MSSCVCSKSCPQNQWVWEPPVPAGLQPGVVTLGLGRTQDGLLHYFYLERCPCACSYWSPVHDTNAAGEPLRGFLSPGVTGQVRSVQPQPSSESRCREGQSADCTAHSGTSANVQEPRSPARRIPLGRSSDTATPPVVFPTIHFRLPFYDFTTQFFLEFYGISLKPPEGDTAPFLGVK